MEAEVMKVYVNGERLGITVFDDNSTLLEKYSLSVPDSLPRFFQLLTEDKKESFVIADGHNYTAIDIRDRLKNFPEEDLTDSGKISDLLYSFKGITKEEIGLLWVMVNGLPKNTFNIKKLSKFKFSSLSLIQDYLVKYKKTVADTRERISKDIKKREKVIAELVKHEYICIGKFITEEISLTLSISTPNGDNLYGIFDAIEVSKLVPFVALSIENVTYYKVYKHIIPPKEWIDQNFSFNGIYFRVSHTKDDMVDRISSMMGDTESLENVDEIANRNYSRGVWRENNTVELVINTTGFGEEKVIVDRFVSSITPPDRGGVFYTILSQKQSGVKGKFSLVGEDINVPLLCDMITNNNLVKNFLFLNETTGTIMTKKRILLYFSLLSIDSRTVSSSLTISFVTSFQEEDLKRKREKHVFNDIRISKADNLQKVIVFSKIFGYILGMYFESFSRITERYKRFVPKINDIISIKKKKKKYAMAKHIGPRAEALQKSRPELFVQGYPDICLKEKQPILLTDKKEIDAFVEKYGENKIMKFPLGRKSERKIFPDNYFGDYYVCEPREKDEKNDFHVYPGLQYNKTLPNRNIFPLIPCCFKDDQYGGKKKNSKLSKYISGIVKMDDPLEKIALELETKTKGFGNILGPNKLLTYGRYGNVPYNMRQILEQVGYQEISLGKKRIFPIVRVSVVYSPSSFLHCMEHATNKKYRKLDYKAKMEYIKKVRERIADNANIEIGKQSLYDNDVEEIRGTLRDPESYVDPFSYMDVIAEYYNLNIFVFSVSKKDIVEGRLVIPKHYSSTPYLLKKLPERKCVVVTAYESVDPYKKDLETIKYHEKVPFQCEIVGKIISEKGGEIPDNIEYLFDSDSPLSKSLERSLYLTNEIYIYDKRAKRIHYTEEGRTSYTSDFYEGARRQYIDDYGKTRIISFGKAYGNITIFTPPLPNLSIPSDESLKEKRNEVSMKVLLDFMKAKGLYMSSKYVEGNRIEGFWMKHKTLPSDFFVPYRAEDNKLTEKIEKSDKPNPMHVDGTSYLSKVRSEKLLAEYFKQYSLYMFSHFYRLGYLKDTDEESLKKFREFFVVDPEHTYRIGDLNKMLYVEGNRIMLKDSQGKPRIIVPNENMIDRLISYVRVFGINDKKTLLNYSDRKIIDGYYKTIADFVQRKNEIKFISRKAMRTWYTKTRDEQGRTSNTILSYIISKDDNEPYFMSSNRIRNGKICLVQKIEKGNSKEESLKKALKVCAYWRDNMVNLGSSVEPLEDIEGYNLYTDDEEIAIGEKRDLYVYERGDEYMSLLFL